MRQAQRVIDREPALQRGGSEAVEAATVLDDSGVLDVLDAGFVNDCDASRAAVGIRNGVLIGTAVWLTALLALAAFGYL